MRLIKPGRIGSTVSKDPRSKVGRDGMPAKTREIWDDYQSGKKGRKKKEYERNSEGRLVAKKPEPAAKREPLSESELAALDRIQPRTDYQLLEEHLGYQFKDRTLLERALTHRSVLGFRERLDYERLEFLGDAVLDLSIAHLLSKSHPDAREGDLSKMRAALVNTTALATIARALDVGGFIRLGKGELASGGADRPSILADVMEAIVGAIYWDSSYDTALGIIEAIFADDLQNVTPSDPKTELQEALHAAGSEAPTYLVELVEGPEHAPTFVTVVVVDGEIVGRGKGPTKKAAQQLAAAEALAKLNPLTTPPTLAEGQTEILESALLGAPLVQNNNA